jgi:4-alpha-glucanotransferase
MARHAGVLVPLFSIASRESWGTGELLDLPYLGAWLACGGFDRLMLLPLGTLPAGQASPYSSISTFAIDPMYLTLDAVDDFLHAGGVTRLSPAARTSLAAARASSEVRHADVRRAKVEALGRAFEYFDAHEWRRETETAHAFRSYIAREAWWLADYARFVAIAAAQGTSAWREWPAVLRDRHPDALVEVDRRLARDIRREHYCQWLADRQWHEARRSLAQLGVGVVGDLPFGLGIDGPEVWARAEEYDLEVSVGVPPDAFSDTGQDWQLPMYRWDVIARADDELLRLRGRRMAALYDGFRIDHLVGYYRTFGRPAQGEPHFNPAGEDAQRRQGERAVAALREAGAFVIAEDLGSIPDFVRESMAELRLAGHKVLRWEREWNVPGRPFIDPADYPSHSMAATGTHDLEPLAAWWDAADPGERAAVTRLPALANAGVDAATPWSDTLRDRFLQLAYSAGSDDLFLPIQDIFGWRDRINTPATVGPHNWTWKLPWPIDTWPRVADAVERARFCRDLSVCRSMLEP